MKNLLLIGLILLFAARALAENGEWKIICPAQDGNDDATPIIIIGSKGGALSGAYRIDNSGESDVRLCLNNCPCKPFAKDATTKQKQMKNVQVLRAGNSIDLFVNSCLSVEEFAEDNKCKKGATGTYEQLSPVSAP